MESPSTSSRVKPLPVLQTSFAGGQRDRDHPSLLGPDQYARGLDLEIRDAALAKTRRGRTNKANSPGSYPQGAIYFEPTSGAGMIVQVNSGKVWKWSGGATWTRVDSSVTLSNTTTAVEMIVFLRKLYIFSGTADNVRQWDGVAVTLTDLGNNNANPPLGSILCQQAGRICAAGTSYITGDTIFFSDPLAGTTWDRTLNTKVTPTDNSQVITALTSYRNADILAFTRNTIHLWTVSGSLVSGFERLQLDTQIGCIAPLSVSVFGQNAYFLDADRHVRNIVRNQNDQVYGVSLPITWGNPNLMGRINKTYAYKSAGVFFDNYYLLAAPMDTNTFNSSVIPFDMLHQNNEEGTAPACLGEWTNIHAFQWVIAYLNGVRQLYYIDAEDGSLYLMFDGTSDDGSTIDMEIDLRAFDWAYPNNDKTVHSAEAQVIDSTGTLTLAFATDGTSLASLQSDVIDSSNPSLPIALPFALGTGGLTKVIEYPFYREGRSRYWQPGIRHTGGILNLKQLSMRGWVEAMTTR